MRQRKLAAKVLKCGEAKIWIDPTNDKVKTAITRKDIRGFIREGIIRKIPDKKRAPKPERPQQRRGSVKGSRGARQGKKEVWLKKVRPQRRVLMELKEKNMLNEFAYRKIYGMIKGGSFRSKSHLMTFLKENKYVKEAGA